jgi:hypothetical protein
MRFLKRSRLAAAAMLLFACGTITEPICGCSPLPPGTGVLAGRVTDPAATSVRDATVRVRVLNDETCAELPPPAGVLLSTPTDGAGRFRALVAWDGPVRKCFQLWAEPPQGSTLAPSDSPRVRLDLRAAAPLDSVEVVLRLR